MATTTLKLASTRKGEIAFRNDVFRRKGMGITITRGVQEIPNLRGLLEKVRWYSTFTPDNDPYGEHDFGSLNWEGMTVFWKIDYYDQQLQRWEDPLSKNCRRVLTVMLADEY